MISWDCKIHESWHLPGARWYIYTYVFFGRFSKPKKDMVKISTKKWILPLFSTNFPSFPMAVFVVAYICFFFTFAVWWGMKKPWFTKERRSRVYTFPADARRSLSQDWPIQPWIFGGWVVQVTDHLQTTTHPPAGSGILLIWRPTDLADSFLVNRNHRFGHKSRVSIWRFLNIIFFLNNSTPWFSSSSPIFQLVVVSELRFCRSYICQDSMPCDPAMIPDKPL